MEAIERYVNKWIIENIPVCIEWKSYKEALEEDAIAIFEEKYGDWVRLVSIDNISKELCGGTHVKYTGEIGFLKIISESAVARGVRRIEAKCGLSAYEYIKEEENKLKEVLKQVKCTSVDELIEKNRKLQEKLKKTKGLEKGKPVKIENIKHIGNFNVVSEVLEGYEIGDLRNLSDVLRSKIKSGVVILFNKADGRVNCVVNVSKDATSKFDANKIVKGISYSLGGSGGGRKEFAQGGGKRVEIVEDIVKDIEKYL
jgi:alanyl-tRNA synthetase